jgi:hypothetical protein
MLVVLLAIVVSVSVPVVVSMLFVVGFATLTPEAPGQERGGDRDQRDADPQGKVELFSHEPQSKQQVFRSARPVAGVAAPHGSVRAPIPKNAA